MSHTWIIVRGKTTSHKKEREEDNRETRGAITRRPKNRYENDLEREISYDVISGKFLNTLDD